MEHIFWKDGQYEATGGIFVRNNLKEFFQTLKTKGMNPVGLKIDDESFNLEVIVEKNQDSSTVSNKDSVDWEQVFDNAQSMHLQEFINRYKPKQ